MERSSGAAPPSQQGGSGQDTMLTVHVEDSREGAAIVSVAGELDLSTVPRMESALLEQLRQRPAVLVDLSALDFIDSSGIGALIRANRTANGTPVSFLIRTGSQVERVFGIACVEEALPLFSDRQAAMATLAGSGS